MRNNVKMLKQVQHDNMQGRSMVEMLGVLAIIGVLSAGGLAGYSKAMFKHKLNNTIDQITMLATAIRTHYGEQGNYSGLSVERAYQLGIIPAAMLNQYTSSNKKIYSPFNGEVSIAAAKAKSADETSAITGFTIAYDRLPQEACVALATADFGSGAGSGFIGVDILANDTKVADAASTAYIGGTGGSGNGEGKPYSISQASSTATNHCLANAKNAIVWKFY